MGAKTPHRSGLAWSAFSRPARAGSGCQFVGTSGTGIIVANTDGLRTATNIALQLTGISGGTIDGLPATSDELMADLLARGTYDDAYPLDPGRALRFSRERYCAVFAAFPASASNPVSPSRTVPCSAPRREATTGMPWLIAQPALRQALEFIAVPLN